MTSEGYTLTPDIKFSWRNKTTDGVTKWTIKLIGNVGEGVTTLETKVIKKEDNPEYFKPFKSNEVTFQAQDFTMDSIKSGLKVEVYYNDDEILLMRKTIYLRKNMFSIAVDLLNKITETLFVYTPKIKPPSSKYVTIKSKTGTKKFIINQYDEFEYADTSKVWRILKDDGTCCKDQTFEEKYKDKPCFDIFYVHNIDDGSGEFYLRSANNSMWARKFRRYYRTDSNHKNSQMAVHKLNIGDRNKGDDPNGGDRSRFFYQEYDKANEVTNRKDQFHQRNTKDLSWRDNARRYKVNTDDGCLYRIEDGEDGETETKISDDEIVIETVVNSCDVIEIGKDTGIENKYDSPLGNGEYNKLNNNDWSGGCRHLGEYDRKGKTEGCEGKFSTADLYSSPPFRHLLKEFHTYTNDSTQKHNRYKRQRNGRYTSQQLNDKVCPEQTENDKGEKTSIMKDLKKLIDAQCEALENKGFCVKEKPNSATSAKIKTIQDGFNESKMKALRSTDSDSKYVREALHHAGRAIGDDFNPDTHLPDFDTNFSTICKWRGGKSKSILEEEKCHARPRQKLEGWIKHKGYKDSAGWREREDFKIGYEKIKKKCSETTLNNCHRPENNDFGSDFFDLYDAGNYHSKFSVCEKAVYGWDDEGVYYNVAEREAELAEQAKAVEAANER
tara:strand:- start:82 stop:2082 length:2001 start_codon:yes stop_codon:yes gene_type:complete